MTAWNQPQVQGSENMNGMPPTPPAPLSPMVARRRASGSVQPVRVGVTMLLLAIVLFLASFFGFPSVSPTDAVSIAEDGSAQSFTLLEDKQYGFYSDDANLSWRGDGPLGAMPWVCRAFL